MAFDLKVDHYTTQADTGEMKLLKETPYLRIKVDGNPPLFCRAGVVYDEGGEVHNPIPDYIETELMKVTEAQLQAHGFSKESGQILSTHSERASRKGR